MSPSVEVDESWQNERSECPGPTSAIPRGGPGGPEPQHPEGTCKMPPRRTPAVGRSSDAGSPNGQALLIW